ncbi:MAG: PD40 domain-containing protein [Saprospiraceae bacterium]|nr:PD40 domain-containing protein [Saprospiraceae bacterium]
MNKLMRAALVVCSLMLLVGRASAQTPRAYENAADNAMGAKDYYAAMQYFGKVLEMEPNRLDVSYRYADAARQFGAYGQAEALLQQTLEADKNGKFPDASFKLANVKKYLGKYDEAIRLYRRYTATATANSPLRKEAERDIEQCIWALERLTNPDRSILVERLPDEAPNTAQSDFAATLRDNTLIYSSFREIEWGDKNYPKRPISKVLESSDGSAGVFADFNDAKRHTANTAFSADGKVLVFSKCDYVGAGGFSCDLHFTYRTSAGWAAAVKLPDVVNVPGYNTTQPHVRVAEDGYYELYFVSDRPGGLGGLDIWKAPLTLTGSVGKPENLAALNTPNDEVTPFFYEKDKTLYFSTNGRQSVGGFDIYKSVFSNNTWQTPEHLDVPLNSSYDDLYYAPQNDDMALFTSNREESAAVVGDACCYDIYKATYLPIELKTLAFAKPEEAPLDEVVFTLTEAPAKLPSATKFSGDKNEADFAIRRCQQYMVIAQKEFYKPDTVYVETNSLPADRKFVEKLYLVPEIGLAVKTFHEWTKEPLFDVLVRIYEIPGVVSEQKRTGSDSNESKMEVGGLRMFTVIAEKEGFLPDTAVVTAEELRAVKAGTTMYKNLFLSPANMSAYLPITLYFDNDQPDPRTRYTTTSQTYEQTVERYLTRRAAFVEQYTNTLKGVEKEQAVEQLGKFFDEEVQTGYVKLEVFASNLGLFLKGGSSIEIMVKSFASPLASSDYNMALTQRRIASVRNYFRKYDDGIFEQYVRSGQLKVSTLPLGESAAPPHVSDDARDKRRSVYSIEASRERRAEIIEVRMFKN